MGQYNNEDINMDAEQIKEILRQRKMAEESIPIESNPKLINRSPDNLSSKELENVVGGIYKTLGIKPAKPSPSPSPMEGPDMSPMMSFQEALKKYQPDILQPKAPDVYAPSEAPQPLGPEMSQEMQMKRLYDIFNSSPELGSKSNLDKAGGELPKSLIEALGDPSSNYMNSNAPFAGVEHNIFPKTKQKLKRIDLNPDGSHKSFHFDTSGDAK